MEGYRAQGRYWLRSILSLPARARPAAVSTVAAGANHLSILAMLLEDRAANGVYFAVIDQINTASVDAVPDDQWLEAIVESVPKLTARAIAAIKKQPEYSGDVTAVDGLSGESIIE